MKYFVNNKDRESTAYHEFVKGKWNGKSFWNNDSICLHDDVLVTNAGFYNALKKVIPGYDPYAIAVEVSRDVWAKVGEAILSDDLESIELYKEANEWAMESLEKYGCFTILGL